MISKKGNPFQTTKLSIPGHLMQVQFFFLGVILLPVAMKHHGVQQVHPMLKLTIAFLGMGQVNTKLYLLSSVVLPSGITCKKIWKDPILQKIVLWIMIYMKIVFLKKGNGQNLDFPQISTEVQFQQCKELLIVFQEKSILHWTESSILHMK